MAVKKRKGRRKMRHCYQIKEDDYHTDSVYGYRFGSSPMAHYPNTCPFFPGDKVGDCIKQCGGVLFRDRACYRLQVKVNISSTEKVGTIKNENIEEGIKKGIYVSLGNGCYNVYD
jgi:hypothetical protein